MSFRKDRLSRLADRQRAVKTGRGLTLALLLYLLFSSSFGCAYFNTFYYAKKYYNDAEKNQAKSKSDLLSTQAEGAYDKSIEKCLKVIEEHGGGWRAGIDDALYLMGACYYGKRDYETAIQKFNQLVLNHPDSDHIQDAMFFSGMCYFKLRNIATAERIFARVLNDDPDYHRRDEIVMATADAFERDGNDAEAAKQYNIIINQYRDSDKRAIALDRLGKIYFDEGEFDSAFIAYNELSRNTQDDELYFESQLSAGASLVRLRRYSEALEVYDKIMPENADRIENGGRVKLAMAEALSRSGQYDESLELLTEVSEGFPNRALGLEADFRKGYTYEVYLKDYTSAREAYESAGNANQRSIFKDQAKRRLINVKYLEEITAISDSTGTGTRAVDNEKAKAALQVAEFTYFESDDLPLALSQYQDVIDTYPESKLAVRAAFARGWIYYTEFDSLAKSSAELEQLAENYPATSQAEKSLLLIEEIGLASPERRQELSDRVFAALILETARLDSIRADSVAVAALIADSIAVAQAIADSIAALNPPAVEEEILTTIPPVDSLVTPSDSLNTLPPRLETLRAARERFTSREMMGETDSLALTADSSQVSRRRPEQLSPDEQRAFAREQAETARVADSLTNRNSRSLLAPDEVIPQAPVLDESQSPAPDSTAVDSLAADSLTTDSTAIDSLHTESPAAEADTLPQHD